MIPGDALTAESHAFFCFQYSMLDSEKKRRNEPRLSGEDL